MESLYKSMRFSPVKEQFVEDKIFGFVYRILNSVCKKLRVKDSLYIQPVKDNDINTLVNYDFSRLSFFHENKINFEPVRESLSELSPPKPYAESVIKSDIVLLKPLAIQKPKEEEKQTHEKCEKDASAIFSIKCDIHPKQDKEQYCFECKKFLCFLCILEHKKNNPTHTTDSMSNIIMKVMTDLEQINPSATPTDSVLAQLAGIEDHLKSKIVEFDEIIEKVKNGILHIIEEWSQSHKKELMGMLVQCNSLKENISFIAELNHKKQEMLLCMPEQYSDKKYQEIVDAASKIQEIKQKVEPLARITENVTKVQNAVQKADIVFRKDEMENLSAKIDNVFKEFSLLGKIEICCECGKKISSESKIVCLNCSKKQDVHCNICAKKCELCMAYFCINSQMKCRSCSQSICSKCATNCRLCKGILCKNCNPNGSFTCRDTKVKTCLGQNMQAEEIEMGLNLFNGD